MKTYQALKTLAIYVIAIALLIISGYLLAPYFLTIDTVYNLQKTALEHEFLDERPQEVVANEKIKQHQLFERAQKALIEQNDLSPFIVPNLIYLEIQNENDRKLFNYLSTINTVVTFVENNPCPILENQSSEKLYDYQQCTFNHKISFRPIPLFFNILAAEDVSGANGSSKLFMVNIFGQWKVILDLGLVH